MLEEISALTMQGTWYLVPRPANTNIVGSKWIYKIKRNSDRTVSHYKARLVAQGFSQEAGFDYDETFSPVAPRAWNAKFTGYLPSLGFKMSHSDPSLFVKISDSAIVVLLLYVDDIILISSNSHVIQEVIIDLGSVFDLMDLGPFTFFLGLQISYKSNGDLFINQQKPDLAYYVNTVCQFMNSPIEVHFQLVKRILSYIQGTLHYGLTYSSSIPVYLFAYSDADWAGDITSRRSTIGLGGLWGVCGVVFTQWLELVRAVRIVRRLVSLARLSRYIYCTYALAVWFGSRLIREKGYSGGAVLNVILSVVTASPCLSAFAASQVAAFKMFETISRKQEIDAYDEKGKTLDDIRGDIELREVFFQLSSQTI
ncbi:unnamed protein product [Prunus brigantina]